MSLLKSNNLFVALFAACAIALCLALTGCQEEGEYVESAGIVEIGQEAEGDFDAAQKLVGQTLTKEEIEAAAGTGERYDMNSAGCERGVYGCYFYYSNFSIFAKTYDKGATMTVASVSE